MVAYEIMYILSPELDEEANKAAIERLQNLVTEGGGEVSKVDVWGKRRLAYEVKDFREGFYVVMLFKAPTEVAAEIERIIKINESYIRYLLLRDEKEIAAAQAEEEEEKPAVEEQPAAPADAAEEAVEETAEETESEEESQNENEEETEEVQ